LDRISEEHMEVGAEALSSVICQSLTKTVAGGLGVRGQVRLKRRDALQLNNITKAERYLDDAQLRSS
jgi:hypothetical protein